MQALFLVWSGPDLVRVDCLHTISGADLSATARAHMRNAWAPDDRPADLCRIYLVKDRRLYLAGEEVTR